VIVTCPECRKQIDTEQIDLRKHAFSHWGVVPRDIGRLNNSEAVRRYNILLQMAEKADLEKDMIDPKIPDISGKLNEGEGL